MKKKRNIIRILAYDPGLSKTGWSVVDFDIDQPKMIVHKYGIFQATNVANKVAHSSQVEKFGLRTVTIALVRQEQLALYEHLSLIHI